MSADGLAAQRSGALTGVVLDRFELSEVLGHGGMGVVYEARDRRDGRRVALKTLHGMSAEQRYRLKREFRALAAIVHTNLAELYELIDTPEHCFFTMERLHGAGLSRYVRGDLAEGLRLEAEGLARMLHVLPQLIDGVCALHAAGQIHCDIKPSNILVEPDGRLVLLDYGLVRPVRVDDNNQTVAFNGTPAYAAPEQMLAAPQKASDWYSVGVTLLELLEGRRFFSGPLPEIMFRKQRGLPASFIASLPAPLRKPLRGLLEPDPQRRWGAPQLLAAMDQPAIAPLSRRLPRQAPFVGRAAEIGQLDAALAGVVEHSRPALVRLRGPSGIGKSELVEQFLSRLQRRRPALVLRSKCRLQEAIAHQALDPIVDELSRYLVALQHADKERLQALVPVGSAALCQLFPVLGRVSLFTAADSEPAAPSSGRRHQAYGAFCQLLRRIGHERPVVMWIDDAQWGDRDSSRLLRTLLERDGLRLLLLLSHLGEGAPDSPLIELSKLEGPGHIAAHTQLLLQPLPPRDGKQLAVSLLQVAGIGPAAAAGLAADIVAESAGSPFLIGELARFVVPAQLAAGTAESSDGALIGAAEAVGRRVAGLAPVQRQLLEFAAIAGGPIAVSLLLGAAAAEPSARADIRQLCAQSWLRYCPSVGAEHVEIRHQRIRDALMTQLSPRQRAAHHLSLAEALQQSAEPQDPLELVRHWRGAGEPVRASRHALIAAEQAEATMAFDRAAALYRLMLEHPPDEPPRWQLQARLAAASVHAGRGLQAAQAYTEAAAVLAEQRGDGADVEVLALQRLAAEQFLRSGYVLQGSELLREVLQALGVRYPQSRGEALGMQLLGRARLSLTPTPNQSRRQQMSPREQQRLDACWSAMVGLTWADNLRSSYFQVLHTQWAFEGGDERRVIRALASEGAYLAVGGSTRAGRRSEAIAEEAIRRADAHGDHDLRAYALACSGIAAFLRGQWRASLRDLFEAEALIVRHLRTFAWELTNCRLFTQWALALRGDLARLAQLIPEWIQLAQARDDVLAATYLSVGMSVLIDLAADAPERARQRSDAAIARWSRQGHPPIFFFHLVGATLIDLYEDRSAAAWSRMQDAHRHMRVSLLLANQVIRGVYRYTRGCVAVAHACAAPHERKHLLRLARRTAGQLAGEGARWCRALAEALYAAIEAASGNPKRAVQRLRAAERQLSRCDLDLYAAAAHRRLQLLSGEPPGGAAPDPLAEPAVRRPDQLAWCLLPVSATRRGTPAR